MPPVIAWVVDEIAYFLVVELGVEYVTLAYFVAEAVVYTALAFATNKISAALGPAPPRGSVGSDITSSSADPLAPAAIVLGSVRAGGVYTIPPFNSGNNGEMLHLIYALAGHEIDSFSDVYFGQDRVANADIAAVTGTDGDGKVNVGTWANNHWVRRYTGTATQTVDYILSQAFPSAFTADFRGRGIAYAAVRLKFDEASNRGQLPQISFAMKGARVYDPRADSTNGGSGSQRYATPSTWVWSANPALCAAWYIINVPVGMGYDPATEINWPSVIAAANICDASLSGAVAPPSGAQPRYACSTVLNATNDPLQNLRAIVDSMLGGFVQTDGVWTIWAGAYASPVHALSYTDFVGPVQIQACSPRTSSGRDTTERYNGVRVLFVNPAKNWQGTECYPRVNDTYKTADGGERIWKELQVPACTDEYQAQRIGEFALRASRNQIVVAGALGPKWLKLGLRETVTLTWPDLGWVSKIFRVNAYTAQPNGAVQAVLHEEQSADWNDLLTAEYDTPSVSTIPAVNPYQSSAPTALATVPGPGTITLSWTPSVVTIAGARYRVLENTVNTFGTATEVFSGSATSCVLARNYIPTYYYWVETVDADGSVHGPYPAVNGVTGQAQPTGIVWVPTGNAIVGMANATKSGGSAAWDSAIYVLTSHPTCHVSAKANDLTDHWMIGLAESPLANSSYTGTNKFLWYKVVNAWHIYEAGVDVYTGPTATLIDRVAIEYDGTNITYWLNGALIRTTAAAGLTLYGYGTFFDTAGGGLNSLAFGPTTNLAVNDTSELGANAATDVLAVSVATYTGSAIAQAIATVAVPAMVVDYIATVTASLDVWKTNANAASCYLAQLFSGTPGGTASQAFAIPLTATPGTRISLVYSFPVSAAAPPDSFAIWYSSGTLGNVGHAINIDLRVDVVKR